MRSITRKILLLSLILIILITGTSFATGEFKEVKKSAEFEKWESLDNQERANSIQPSYKTITFKDNIKRSTYNRLLTLKENLQDDYYPKTDDDKLHIKVKNQDYTNACWAFSYSSVLEAVYEKELDINTEYSPMHIELKTAKMFNRDIDSGGNAFLGVAYSISGNGPVLETDMPISSVYSETEKTYVSNVTELDLNKTVTGQVTETKILPSIYKTYLENEVTYTDGQIEYTQEQVNAIRNTIKAFIKENGAITANMYTDISINEEGEYTSDYFNVDTSAYYCDDSSQTSNHAITIVGWDDGYEINNFREDKQPTTKGAYIVLNSYGTEFGDNGYMYISYEDFAIEQILIGIDSVKSEKEYDNIYQYDELGANNGITMGEEYPSLYAANIFTRNTANQDNDEYLEEIGIYLVSTEGIEVYFSNNGDLTNYEKIAAPGVLEPGYHTIELPVAQKLTGENFAIIIKYTNSEVGATLPIETNLHESGFTYVEDFYSSATANLGESKFSSDGITWNELNDTKIGFFITLKNTNNCIKAFTTYQEKNTTIPVTGVELSEEIIELKQGGTATIIATVKPENATNQNVSWSSSNPDIATVENGVVTGVAEGEATITVTTQDDNKTDTCEVKVTTETVVEVIDVTGVEINVQLAEGVSLEIEEGNTYTVLATVKPENATNQNISWSSSDESIATVENGVIKGIAEGTATITVTTEDGNKTDSIDIKVKQKNNDVNVENITLNKTTLQLEVGDETNLVVSFNPQNVTNKNVTWNSSNTNIATVSETGIIKALAEGTTTITVTSEDGNKSATCELTVIKKTNTDDDIYKDDNNNNNNNSNTNQGGNIEKDNTLAKDELPNTGLKIVLILLVITIISIGTISFIKYRKFIDIK